MTAAGRPPRGPVASLVSVTRMELTLRMRNPAVPLLLTLILTACALLVPERTAGYAVVVIDGHRPVMSADASLAAAGVVLTTLLVPLFSLFLDAGHLRDAQLGTDRLLLTTPVRAEVVAAGRLCANGMFVLAVAVLSLFVISGTIMARSLGVPSPSAAAVFLLMVVPAGLVAVLVGAVLDRWLGRHSGSRTVAAFGIWFAAMALSLAGTRDLLGMSYLRQVTAHGEHTPALSVGVITDNGLPLVPWTAAPLTSEFLRDRLMLSALLLAGAAILALLLRRGLLVTAAFDDAMDRSPRNAPRWTAPSSLPSSPQRPGGRAGPMLVLVILLTQWSKRSKAVPMLILLTLALALRGDMMTGAALATALLIAPTVLAGTSRAEVRVAATLEATTGALHRPSPMLTSAGTLALVAMAAAAPALVRLDAVHAATAILGLLATTMWLTWAYRCAARPVLGASVFAISWYADAFNHPPRALDVLGLWHPNLRALASAAILAGITFALLRRHDRVVPT